MKSNMMANTIKGKRRLAAEQAIMFRGYKTFKECAEACEKLAENKGINATFNPLSIQHFVTCNCNLSLKRLMILAELLNMNDFKQLNEVYSPPNPRGVGKDWVGEYGSRVADYDASKIIL